jgi:CO dehydrogenase maturation factor
LNRLKNGIPPAIEDEIRKSGLILVATIPEDFEITELDIKGEPLTKLPLDSKFRRSVQEMLFRLKIR